MTTDSIALLNRSLRRWKGLSLCLALALGAGVLLGQVEPKQPAPPEPLPPRAVMGRAPRQVLQPSDSVEATALAIAYDILREGGTEKLPASNVGGFAAEILNEFKAKQK